MKLFKRNRLLKMGYIKVIGESGKSHYINIRAIMDYYPYSNPFTVKVNTRIVYLNNEKYNLRSTFEEIENQINRINGKDSNNNTGV